MIHPEILEQLVPGADLAQFPRNLGADQRAEGAAGRIASWSAHLRYLLARAMTDDSTLRMHVLTSGFVGTGIFQVPPGLFSRPLPGFPVVHGYQFGAMFLRGSLPVDGLYGEPISAGIRDFQIPLIHTVATQNFHASGWRDGYAAAVFEPTVGMSCGITARHVVERYRRGQRVPVCCSDCGTPARLLNKAPGLIDAASVRFTCGGPPGHNPGDPLPTVRPAIEGETVEMHLGDTGKIACTVMQSLSSPLQILSAATPQHFLTDQHGDFGDSGSLVSAIQGDPPDLIGIYLGDADCVDAHGNQVTYGYGLDLKQAAAVLGAKNLKGEFNV